ncbi:SgrR family transcriptional regulator [Vibrio sp.]|uniref:SgrR family transcriptional regulator n=1 Tax=Vibrio sp. TaxID=678 RepID=UPI003D0E110F
MSSPRLRIQFDTLFEHYKGNDSDVQLDEITEILFCTRRNARIVLNKMEEEGWIEWRPAPGRGKLSQLRFKRSRTDVCENLARRYLEEGKIGQALNVLDKDSAKLAQVVESYLGVQHQQGLQVVRLPYYRSLTVINPTKPMRRSEQHIARQVFSGLTKLDEHENLQPDLSHAWERLTPCHWRFYLRPGVRFHNGDLLGVDIILNNLQALTKQRLFSHICSVSSPSNWVIDVQLSKPDYKLPQLLAESSAKIMPLRTSRHENFDRFPNGTGPYKVIRNDDKRLVLQAFDGYFGFRPLMDQVEVWVIDEAYSSVVFPSLSNPIKPDRGNSSYEVELDPGCTYLLLNRRDGLAKDNEWANYFCNKLNTLNLFNHLPADKIVELGLLPAHGLKPGWYHQIHSKSSLTPPQIKPVKIAFHGSHPMFPSLVKSIEKILKQDGLEVCLMPYDVAPANISELDIWLKPMGIGHHRDDALAGWLLNYSDIERASQDVDFQHWQDLVDQWRSVENATFPAKELGKSLVEKMQIIPMFHCWLGVSQDQCGALQNAKCNALGWFDFSQVWVKPELADSNEPTGNTNE